MRIKVLFLIDTINVPLMVFTFAEVQLMRFAEKANHQRVHVLRNPQQTAQLVETQKRQRGSLQLLGKVARGHQPQRVDQRRPRRNALTLGSSRGFLRAHFGLRGDSNASAHRSVHHATRWAPPTRWIASVDENDCARMRFFPRFCGL